MNELDKKVFGVETDFIRVRQNRINDIVEAVHAGLDIGNIDLTEMNKVIEARMQEADLFALLDELKETTMNEQEKEVFRTELEKWFHNEDEKQA